MPTTTASSNVLKFPVRSPSRIDSVRRFGRPRYSSLYLLGVRLFKQTISVPITMVTRFVVGARSHQAGRRLRRSGETLLRALDDLIVLNARAYPGNLDVLLQEIETRKRHWQIATTDIHGSQGS
jgi:hypothetical protein